MGFFKALCPEPKGSRTGGTCSCHYICLERLPPPLLSPVALPQTCAKKSDLSRWLRWLMAQWGRQETSGLLFGPAPVQVTAPLPNFFALCFHSCGCGVGPSVFDVSIFTLGITSPCTSSKRQILLVLKASGNYPTPFNLPPSTPRLAISPDTFQTLTPT